MNILDFPAFVKDHFQVEYIEVLMNQLVGNRGDHTSDLAAAASRAGVVVVCLALDNDFTLPTLEISREIARTAALLDNARILGAPLARVNPGMQGQGTEDELAQRIATAISHLISEVKRLGLTLGLENQHPFGLKADNIIKVMDMLPDGAPVGVCLDLGNFSPRERSSGPAKLAPYAVHVHAKSYGFTADGSQESRIDYAAHIGRLHQAGYSGYLSVEWEGTDAEEELPNVSRTVQLIRRTVAEIGDKSNAQTV